MDFSFTREVEELRHKTRAFISESVVPLESDSANYDDYENIRLDILESIRVKAKKSRVVVTTSSQIIGWYGINLR